MKKIFTAVVLAAIMLVNVTTSAAHVKNRETIYQVALLQSLAMGYFNGVVSVGDLKTHGDTGIGTFEGLDGEMIVLDGVVYRANQNCRVNVVADNVTVPFSNVTFFDKDFSVNLNNVRDKELLEKTLTEAIGKHGANSFYVIKMHGTFNEILVRSELGQSKPYPTLVESLKATQKEFTHKNITGTVVGLYCPEFMSSLNSTGWHFHFVSDDKKIGGHVLGLNVKRAEALIDKTDNFQMILPAEKDFNALNFKVDTAEDIRKAERDSYQGGK